MLSQDALQVLAYELFDLLESPHEFDSIFLEVIDNGTAVLMEATRNDRTKGFRYTNSQNIDLRLGLEVLRGYFRRTEVN